MTASHALCQTELCPRFSNCQLKTSNRQTLNLAKLKLIVKPFNGENHLHRPTFPDEPSQLLRSASATHNSEVYFRLRKSGIFAGDTNVTGQSQFISSPQTKTVNHGNDRFWESVNRIKKCF